MNRARALIITAVAAFLTVGGAGASWAGTHGGVSATVTPSGTAVYTTTNGPAPEGGIKVALASYSGLWKNQTQPEQLFASVTGTIPAGQTTLTLQVAVPSCGPFQVDALLGWTVQPTITYPTGSSNGLKGQEYTKINAPCTTPSPTPTTPKPTPTSTVPTTAPATHHPSPTPTQPTLAKTGTSLGLMGLFGSMILLSGALLIGLARPRRSRH